jgi:hypothetical protein
MGHCRLYVVDDFLIQWERDNIVGFVGVADWLDYRDVKCCYTADHCEVLEVTKHHELGFGEKKQASRVA